MKIVLSEKERAFLRILSLNNYYHLDLEVRHLARTLADKLEGGKP